MPFVAIVLPFINSIVAVVGVALLAGDLLVQGQIALASLVGVVVAVLLMAAFLAHQRWRYRIFDQ